MKIGIFEIEKTCDACPEQYQVTVDGKNVAYLRLRHGRFYAACPDVGGEVVYQAYPEGDGVFNPAEREVYLISACAAIATWMFYQSISSLGTRLASPRSN